MHTAAGPSNQVQPGRQAPIPDGEGGVYARRRCDDLSGGVHHRLGEVMLKGIVGKQVCDVERFTDFYLQDGDKKVFVQGSNRGKCNMQSMTDTWGHS